MSNRILNLTSYLNLYQLLKEDSSSKEERRAFRLSLDNTITKPLPQLLSWQKEKIMLVCQKPFLSDSISSYLYKTTSIFVLIASILGFISGSLLLSYSGKEPVNIIYFMSMVVLLPLFTMFLALLSLLKIDSKASTLIHLSPAFWMEKIFKWIDKKESKNINFELFPPKLLNLLLLERSQLIALFFYAGLLFSLLWVILTQDIAFAWSTTLSISSESFHAFLYQMSFPWREIFPWAVPSLELIEQSHYFRLGDRLNLEMVAHASTLGEWWKFLAFSTLFYALFLRVIVYLIIGKIFKRTLKESFLTLEGVNKLLREMNEVIVTTKGEHKEKIFVPLEVQELESVENLDNLYDVIQGWSLLETEILDMSHFMDIYSNKVFCVGGGNSLKEDTQIIKQSFGKVLLYVKAWEPPTMDFMDYIEELLPYVEQLIIYPIGTKEEQYVTQEIKIDIWERKISQLNSSKVWIKR